MSGPRSPARCRFISRWCSPDFLFPVRRSGWRAAYADSRVAALIAVGTPVGPVAAGEEEEPRVYTFDFLQDCTKPKLFVSGARDQFGPRTKLEALVRVAARAEGVGDD